MAIDDVLGSPVSTVDELIQRTAPEEATTPVNPRMVVDRLTRKMMTPMPPPVDPVGAPSGMSERKPLDLSDHGVPADQINDFSSLGVPAESAPQDQRRYNPAVSELPADQKPKAARTWGDTFSDLAKNWSIGQDTLVQNARELVDRIPSVGKDIGKKLDEIDTKFGFPVGKELEAQKKATERSLTPQMQESLRKKWWDEGDKKTPLGWFGDAWSDPNAYAGGITQSLPEQAITMLPSTRLAKWAYEAKIAAGASVEAASKTAARTAAISGGVLEGLFGGAGSAREVREAVHALPEEVLQQSEAYQALLRSGMSPQDARSSLAEDKATLAFMMSGTVTGLFGGMGDRAVAKILTQQMTRKSVGSTVKGAAAGALGEGVFEEFPQSAGQKLSENVAVSGANPQQRLGEGVLNEAFGGLAMGGVQGGAIGAATSLARGNTPPGGPALAPGGGAPAGGSPPAGGGGTPPGAGPMGGPAGGPAGTAQSSPADIAEFLRRARETTPEQGEVETDDVRRGRQTRAEIDEFLRQREGGEAAPNGPTDDDIVRATLKEAGWMDRAVDEMSEPERRFAFAQAIDEGIKPTDALAKHWKRPGSRTAPINAQTADDVRKAQPSLPSPGQAAAENYRQAHMDLPSLGLTGKRNVTIETAVGSTRQGTDAGGKPWKVENFPAAYGKIKGTKGADGQPLDIFIGANPEIDTVYVIDQNDPKTGKFDEHKIMAGMRSPIDALRTYDAAYSGGGRSRIGGVTMLTRPQFDEWLASGDTTKALKKAGAAPGAQDATPESGQAQTMEVTAGEPASEGPNTGGQRNVPPRTEEKTPDEAFEELGNLFGGTETEASDHIDDVIEVLGEDAREVLPADVVRAAEIIAETGATPEQAFQQAVIENAVEQGFLDYAELESVYGEESIEVVLGQPAAAPERGADAAPEGKERKAAEAGGERAGEAEQLPGGSTTGGPRGSTAPAGLESDAERADDDAAGDEPDAGGETGRDADGTESLTPEQFREKYGDDGDHDPETEGDNVDSPGSMDEIYEIAQANLDKGNKPSELDSDKMPTDQLFPKPKATVRAANSAGPVITQDEAAERLAQWKAHAARIGRDEDHSNEVILSLFDRTGVWSKPYADAGYRVIQYDIEHGDDLVKFFPSPDILAIRDAGMKIVGVLAGPPCTSYAVSGARWWKDQHDKANVAMVEKKYGGFASVYFDTPLEYANALVAITQAVVEFANPSKFHVIENPVGRIQRMNGLPAPTLTFDPNHYGDPYTKKTLLWGAFNPNLPTAHVAATEGSKISEQFRGDDPEEKLKRSETPEGFAYAFFVANNTSKIAFEAEADAVLGDTTKGSFKKTKVKAAKEKDILGDDAKPGLDDLQDVGEKIGGARKDKWAGRGLRISDLDDMTGVERDNNVTKQNVWERPDYVAMVDAGTLPQVAFILKRIYDRIAVKPPMDQFRGEPETVQKRYIMTLEAAREVYGAVKTEADIRDAYTKLRKRLGEIEGEDSYTLFRTVKQPNANYLPFDIRSADWSLAERAVEAGFPNVEPWQRLFMVRKEKVYDWKASAYVKDADGNIVERYLVDRKNGARVGVFNTRDEAIAAAKAAYDKLDKGAKDGEAEPVRPHLDTVTRTGPDYRNGRDIVAKDFIDDFGFRGVEFGNWVAGDERQKVVNLAYDAFHDLARVLNLPAKAISLDGRLAVGFGSRGRGGKNAAAAHYEPARTVINLTKLAGAGTLAHEWAHAVDHYLGELGTDKPYGGSPKGLSGWYAKPKYGYRYDGNFDGRLMNLSHRLRKEANRVMDALFYREETEAEVQAAIAGRLSRAQAGLESWSRHLKSLRDDVRAGRKSSRVLKKAEDAVAYWQRQIDLINANRPRKRADMPTSFFTHADKLSGSGDYWKRPTEMFARAFEAWVFDKIAADELSSQYLVHGTEGTRYGNGFKGNPYPVGEERARINMMFDRLARALVAGDGKLGAGTRLEGSKEKPEPDPIVQAVEVAKPQTPAKQEEEIEAVEDSTAETTLTAAFEDALINGKKFETILQARKLAKDGGFDEDAKAVEEALEYAVVRVGRRLAADEKPKEAFDLLVDLYERQPRLGTRTSESVRDQAYSTPVPLAYVASKLAGIDKGVSVYEPTAGNGALLIEADPAVTIANEINPARRANLKEQGFKVVGADASIDSAAATAALGKGTQPFDVVIANPPFGAVRQEGQSKVFDLRWVGKNYETTEIDHVISFRALSTMKDRGRAVLILGGVNKQVKGEARADAYNGKSKRIFYFNLYNQYNVVDHFTVAGELYERQGAAWPVDVIVIEGRGKSKLKLPAVEAPRVLSTWEEVGGLLDGKQATASERGAGLADGGPADPAVAGGPLGGDGRDRVADGEQRPVADPNVVEPGDVRGAGVSGVEPAGDGGDRAEAEPGERGAAGGAGVAPPAVGQSSGLSFNFESAFNDALDEAYGKDEAPKAKPAPKRDTRSTAQVAKDTAQSAIDSADAAFDALGKLFGGDKLSMGVSFDEETYRKAKPLFTKAAEKFAEFRSNLQELLKRMVVHIRDTLKWSRAQMAEAMPYLQRFFEELATEDAERAKQRPQKTQPPKAEETEQQVTYQPKSTVPGLNTLVPVNMRRSVEESLSALEARVGPIDKFVADELGYKLAELEDAFSAEQVDALGLAIDNIKRGRGFIIGDQTGIGKGRVNAAIIRWSIKNDRIPVFVTMIPGLYTDMYRDMEDIGMWPNFLKGPARVLATNNNLNLKLNEDGQRLKTDDPKKHNALLSKVKAEDFGKDYDVIFTTYKQMQTVKGEDTARRAFLNRIAPRAVLILDESHNAGGQVKTRKPKIADTAMFAREIIEQATGVFYSSATYAKRPDVMDLYSKTDMSMAVDDIKDLADAIARGGVPMQQVVAAMLAKAGQYLRRERSFAGINYDTPLVPVERETYNAVAGSLAAIQDFSKHVEVATDKISDEIRAEGEIIGADNATGEAGASSTLFTSIMHNIVGQMLLALKVEPAAAIAVEALQNGEKPVITVANTMESLLTDYTDEKGIKVGDKIDADFGEVLIKYLERTRTITIKTPDGEKRTHYLTDAELGEAGLMAYNDAKGLIKNIDLSALAASPIDLLKQRIAEKGYRVGEITGRSLTIDYSTDEWTLQTRGTAETSIQGKNNTRDKFNAGELDALILNQSGSTGISLHASVNFKDQKPRVMIIAQAEGNIDTHMQMLGRVNRTGQVVLPRYIQLVADIPAEKRPAALLAKKMASLNANTTASRSSALTAKDVPDFMNQYGDQVAAQFIADNPELNYRLAGAVHVSEETGKPVVPEAIRKVTGRVMLLPLNEQEEVLDYLEDEYASLLAQLEATGENALEAKTYDFRSRTLEYTEVIGEKNDSGSPFAAPVVIEKVSLRRLGRPFTPVEVMQKVANAILPDDPVFKTVSEAMVLNMLEDLGRQHTIIGRKSFDDEAKRRNEAVARFREWERPELEKITDAEKQAKQRATNETIKSHFLDIHQIVRIGARVTLKTVDGNIAAIVIGVDDAGRSKNPLAASNWKATFAVPDASRQMQIPFSRLQMDGKADPESAMDIEVVPVNDWIEKPSFTLDRFKVGANDSRVERFMATGNLLAAYDWLQHKGQILNYTDESGVIHQGILIPKGFDLQKYSQARGRVGEVGEIVKALESGDLQHVTTKNGPKATITKRYREYAVSTPKAKKIGGIYFLDDQLMKSAGTFYSTGNQMMTTFTPDNLAAVVKRMKELGADFVLPAENLKTIKVEPKPEQPIGRAEERRAWSQAALANRPQIERVVRDFIAGIAGDVPIHFQEGLIPLDGPAVGWGNLNLTGYRGAYLPVSDIIEIALYGTAERLVSTAFHEAYHRVAMWLMPDDVRRLMRAETPRLRGQVQRGFGYTAEETAGLADSEIEALAAELWLKNNQAKDGMHVGIRRWFFNLFNGLRRLANALRGLGLRTAEDVFANFAAGGFARNPKRETPTDHARGHILNQEIPMGAAGPTVRRASLPVEAETVNEMLVARGMARLARVANNFGLGRVNPTELRTLIQDKFIRIRNAEQSVSPGLPISQRTHQAESLYYGRTGQRLEHLERTQIDPLVEDMHQRGITLAEMDQYLYARHAAERNAHIASINPAMPQDGSGMSDSDAQAIMNTVAASGRQADFDAIETRVRQMIDGTRATLLHYGLISQTTHDTWENQYTNYVPLRGFNDGLEDDGPVGAAMGFDTRAAEARRALGRESEAQSPIAYTIFQAELAIIRGERNMVGNTWLRFVQNNPDPARWEVSRPRMRRIFDERSGQVRNIHDREIYDNEFVTKIGGQPYIITHHGRAGLNLARALRNMGTANVASWIRTIGTLTRVVARINTQYDPEFQLSNFERDLGEAFINMNEQQRRGFKRRFLKHLLPAYAGAFQALAGRGTNRYAQAFREFDRAGGRVRFFGLDDADDIQRSVQKRLDRLQGGVMARGAMHLERLDDAWGVITGANENAVRLAVYMTARDFGFSITEAAAMALNMTVNFTKKGEWGQYLSAFYAFMNAGIQGIRRMGTALGHPRVRYAVGTLVGISAALTLYNLGAGGEDDEGNSLYLKIPAHVREKNLIIMYPKGMGKDGQYVNWRLPIGFAMFHVLGSEMVALAMGKQKPGKAFDSVLSAMMDALNPFGQDQNKVAQFAPTVARPAIHVETNTSWTGRPIYPTGRNKDKPDSEQYFRSASDFSVWMAQKMNEISGGDTYKKGWVDVHPGTIDTYLQFMTGGVGRFIKGTTETAGRAAEGEFDASKTPFVRRVTGNIPEYVDSQRYNDERQRVRARESTAKDAERNLRVGKNTEESVKVLRERTREGELFNRADTEIRQLRQRVDSVRSDKGKSAQEQKDAITILESRIRQIQNNTMRDAQRLQGGAGR